MVVPLTADNLRLEADGHNQIVCEPKYVGYLRDHGYPIEEVINAAVVKRGDSDTGHMTLQVKTLSRPPSNPNSDVVMDTRVLGVCDCWAYRSNSVDVAETILGEQQPLCPHLKKAFKEYRAADDDNQQTL